MCVAEEFHRLAGRSFEGGDAILPVLREDPGLQRDACRGAEIARGELGHADVVQPGRDRYRLLPVGQAPAIAQIALLLSSPLATT